MNGGTCKHYHWNMSGHVSCRSYDSSSITTTTTPRPRTQTRTHAQMHCSLYSCTEGPCSLSCRCCYHHEKTPMPTLQCRTGHVCRATTSCGESSNTIRQSEHVLVGATSGAVIIQQSNKEEREIRVREMRCNVPERRTLYIDT